MSLEGARGVDTARVTREEVEVDPGRPEQRQLNLLINDYADRRRTREDIEADAKEARGLEEKAELALFGFLEAANLRSVRHERGLFYLNDQAWARVTDEDKARAWAEAEMPEIITLNRQRLSVVVRERIKESRDLPPGVDFTTTQKIGWRRG